MHTIRDKLLSEIQTGFPIITRPFQAVAERAGTSESEVIETLQSLRDEGIIREFGPIFNHRKLGYVSTLIASKVDKDGIDEFADAVMGINEITHNYLRDHEFNIWFTVIALNADYLQTIIRRIETFPGMINMINLPVTKVLKINTVWGTGNVKGKHSDFESESPALDDSAKILVRALEDRFPLVKNPFAIIAERTGMHEPVIMDTVHSWIKSGLIRRFGARLNHYKIGYRSNILAAWKGNNVEQWGKTFAESPHVSHCYLRKPHKIWPYELYTMLHAQSDMESTGILDSMQKTAQGSEMVALKTLKELKKTSMKYFMEE